MNSDLLQAGLPPAQDRLLTTCFLAALLHGIIILGVSFSPPRHADAGGSAKGLEVILVNDRGPDVAADTDAHYLAQRNQRGSGNTAADKRALIPKSSLAPADHPGMIGRAGLAYHAEGRGAAGGDFRALSPQTARPARSNSDCLPLGISHGRGGAIEGPVRPAGGGRLSAGLARPRPVRDDGHL